MAISIVKETIELDEITLDNKGSAYINKKINLKGMSKHQLLQVDMFADANPADTIDIETVITAYPAIPTNMDYQPANNLLDRYPAGGDDSVLFKERRREFNNTISDGSATQFPSRDISANNRTVFYTDHVYINMHFMGGIGQVVENIAFSFLLVLNDTKVAGIEHALGVLQESHNAMCALKMSNGYMRSRTALQGNVFPMWRYGGMRPERTVLAAGDNSFFLEIDTRDAEQMVTTATIRGSVAEAREMQPFDEARGERSTPDWIKFDLNQGIISGAVRSDTIPLKYADNGNTRMF